MDIQENADSEPDSDNPLPAPPQPKPRPWLLIFAALTAIACAALLCFSVAAYLIVGRVQDKGIPGLPGLTRRTIQPVTNQVVFVGNDHNIWLVSPDGENLRPITSDGLGYNFPTWAPDGRYVAFVGPDETRHTALYISSASSLTSTILYNTPDAAPFYLYWTPDSRAITFLTQEANGLSMRRAEVNRPGTNRILETGSPFYWVWSPQGNKLLMHVGGSRAVSQNAHLSLLENRPDAVRVELNLAPGRFQTPLWSADGHAIFYVASDDTGHDAIYKTDPDTLTQKQLASLNGQTATYLAISPDNRHIAYLAAGIVQPVPVGSVYLLDVNGQAPKLVTERSVISFYWSPDGRKLALLVVAEDSDKPSAKTNGVAAPLSQPLQFQWWIYRLDTEQLELLTAFNPTLDFIQTIPYFDQYQLSLTFWSPDSRYLVVASEDPQTKQGTVLVVDATGQEQPRPVGEGTLAVWSWQ